MRFDNAPSVRVIECNMRFDNVPSIPHFKTYYIRVGFISA